MLGGGKLRNNPVQRNEDICQTSMDRPQPEPGNSFPPIPSSLGDSADHQVKQQFQLPMAKLHGQRGRWAPG